MAQPVRPIAPLIWRYGAVLAALNAVYQSALWFLGLISAPLAFAAALVLAPAVILAAQIDHARSGRGLHVLRAWGLGVGVAVFGGLASFFIHYLLLIGPGGGEAPAWIATELELLRARAAAGQDVDSAIQSMEILSSPSAYAASRAVSEALYGVMWAIGLAPVVWLARRYLWPRR